MRSAEVRLDVTAVTPFAEPQQVSATLFAPDDCDPHAPAELLVALPGGGYTRNYYHPQFAAPPGYSFAEYFTSRRKFVLALDHLGTGASSRPEPEKLLSRAMIAEANHLLTAHVVHGMQEGRWFDGLRCGTITRTGVGHSMGGMMAITQQGRFKSFDRLVVAGWTNYELKIRNVDFSELRQHVHASGYAPTPRELMRPFFFSADVPLSLIEADEACGTVASATMGRDGVTPGVTKEEAEKINCPIFLFYSDNDVTDEPQREVCFYPNAADITYFYLTETAHIHNFETRRREWWQMLDRWISSRPVMGAR